MILPVSYLIALQASTMSRSVEALNAQLLSQLECPVCLDTCTPPIYMCVNGHGVCAQCQPQLKECSTCRAYGKPTLRCVQLEKIAVLVELPCGNQLNGCNLMFAMGDLAKHLPKCRHGFICHLCKEWKGSTQSLKKHVMEKHGTRFFQVPTSGELKLRRDIQVIFGLQIQSPLMFGFNGDVFWLEDKFNSATCIFSRTMRIVSHDDEDAARYYYSVEFKSKDAKSHLKVCNQADMLKEGDAPGNMDILIPADIIDANDRGFIECSLKISQTHI